MRQVTSCQDYFDSIQERFLPEQARGVNAVFVYDLTGESGGTWTVTIKDGALSVERGKGANPTVTYTMEASNYVKLVNGHLSGAKAFLTRKLKVSGSIPMAQKMNKFLPPASS
jgi:putative sterol carrier protein